MEFLKESLGDELYTQVSEALKGKDIKLADISKGEYVGKTKFDALSEQVKTLKGDLTARDTQLDTLKKLDPEKLKAEIDTLKAKNKTDSEASDKKLAEITFNHALDSSLQKTGAKNTKALKALLNMDKVKLDGEKLLGFEDQITAIKESEAYLFEDKSADTGGGSNPSNSQNNSTDTDKLSDDEYYKSRSKK